VTFESRNGTCRVETDPARAAKITTNGKKLAEGGTINANSVELDFPLKDADVCLPIFRHRRVGVNLNWSERWKKHFASIVEVLGLKYGPIVGCSGLTCQRAYIAGIYLLGEFSKP
jgi:hypothetical protein